MKAKRKGKKQVVKMKTTSGIYRVESHVKLPTNKFVEANLEVNFEFPYESMKVGDSFVIPAKKNSVVTRSKMYNEARKFRKEINPKFAIVTRTQKDESRRIWRYQ